MEDVFPSLCIKFPQMWSGVLKPDAGASGPKYSVVIFFFPSSVSLLTLAQCFSAVCTLWVAEALFTQSVWMITALLCDEVKKEGQTDHKLPH